MQTKTITKIIIAVIVVVIAYKLIQSYRSENFNPYDARENLFTTLPPLASRRDDIRPAVPGTSHAPLPEGRALASGMMGVSSELLPRDAPENTDFSQFAPKNAMAEANFLDSSRLVGSDTSLKKNSNYQLRSDPEIPQSKGLDIPWGKSTYAADTPRKKLDC